jgi:DNA-binding transcriptional LysR family regulator
MSIEFRQLRHVLALADLGSFAGAAVALRISQPALSRSIQAVEQRLATALFERRRTGTVPTDTGRLFIERARQVVALAESLGREALADRAFHYGHVAVGSGPYPAQMVLGPAVARFTGANPRVTVRLLVHDWDELLRSLQRREIEFLVAETSTLEQERGLEIEPLATHPLYLVARRGHPLAGRPVVTVADAVAFPIVSLSRIAPRFLEPVRAAQRHARERGVAARAFPAVECNALDAVLQMVRNSETIMAAALPGIARELERGELVLLGTESWLHLRYGIVKLKAQACSAAAESLLGFVREAERAAAREEERLAARWAGDRGPGRGPPKRAPRKRRR